MNRLTESELTQLGFLTNALVRCQSKARFRHMLSIIQKRNGRFSAPLQAELKRLINSLPSELNRAALRKASFRSGAAFRALSWNLEIA